VARHIEFDGPVPQAAPPIAAGSHDPLLEWALRESGCELALLAGGSEDGLRRFASGQAVLAGLHIVDPTSGEYNVPFLHSFGALTDIVLIEWAKRRQGIVVAPGNPRGITSLADLVKSGARVARRQEGAGTQTLLRHLLKRDGLRYEDLNLVEPPALTETDLAGAVYDGKADGGVTIETVAARFRLGFIPLQNERFDLSMRRRDYFEPAIQTLLRFAATSSFRTRAAELCGYDLSNLGRVVYNA
jgi:molybdate-binding protein